MSGAVRVYMRQYPAPLQGSCAVPWHRAYCCISGCDALHLALAEHPLPRSVCRLKALCSMTSSMATIGLATMPAAPGRCAYNMSPTCNCDHDQYVLNVTKRYIMKLVTLQ